jgi:hypothetical protein
MSSQMSSPPISTATSVAEGAPARCLDTWPIGAMVATHWLAHGSGPNPDGDDVFEAVSLGLIDLSDEWSVTTRGRAALREHGWL